MKCDHLMLSVASSLITMKRQLCCRRFPLRLCRSQQKIFTTRRLLGLSIAVYVLITLLAFHTFRDRFAVVKRFDSLPSQVVLSGERIQPNVSKMIINITNVTLPEVHTTKKTLVSRTTTVKQDNFNSSNTSRSESCQSWCRNKENSSKPFFLTAVLLVRIYVSDLAQLTTRELRQWLYYLRYAGFEHVYVYDAFVPSKNESQAGALKPLIDEGFVTYVDWSHRAFPYSIDGTQHSAYQDCTDRFGHESLWQSAIDIDEYPFSPTDQEPKFVQRAIARFSKQVTSASELTMQNFLFLGKPLDPNVHPLLIDRLWRRTHRPANLLVKPIYKPSHVRRAIVHHNALSKGRSINFPVEQLRMNHYWGARLQNWGEDTPEIIARTEPDTSMESIVKTLQKCISECLPSVDFVYHKQWN